MPTTSLVLDDLLASWRHEAATASYSRRRDMGAAFERLCQAFLKHDPTQKQQLEAPMPYGQWARERGLSTKDLGIDLVAKVRNENGWCAIQCKFYEKGRAVPKKELDSFIAASGTKDFVRRLFIDTTGRQWSKNAEDIARSQQVPVQRITLQQLRESSIDWAKFIKDDRIDTGPPKTPRPHQQEAIEKAVAGLTHANSRGKLIMACGTGKTYTSLRIAEELAGVGSRALYLVPSLALMAQTVREWSQDAQVELLSFAVCSDSQVGKRRRRNDDNIDMDALDLAFPATTNAVKLAEKAGLDAPDKMTVVFATYQSIAVIGEAQREHGLADFDLIICDEAHRTAGARIVNEEESAFVQVHRQENVRGDRRLYMTATPKVYAETARNRAKQVNAALYSMEDKEEFGPVLYELKFGEAIEQGLLTDYKVIVLTVTEGMVARELQKTLADGVLNITDAGKLLGCWRALAKVDEEEFPEDDRLPMRRAIAYCRDIKSSKSIEKLFTDLAREYRQSDAVHSEELLPEHDVVAQHVDGTFNALRRGDRLNWLESVRPADRACHVLTNARCLSEGVDVPSLDAILFMHPRKSQIDVVQAVGRVMRRARGKHMGYVVLPVVIPSGADAQAALDKSDAFRVVWQMLNAIRSHDERFEAMLNLLEEGKAGDRLGIIALSDWQQRSSRQVIGDGGNGTVGPKPKPDPKLFEDLPQAIRAKIVEKCGNRRYWEEWAGDVADIARRHIERIRALVTRHEASREVFGEFLAELRDDLNDGISESDAIEMLAQHIITRPVFKALHGDARFVDQNPVSKGMQLVLDVLETQRIDQEAQSLEEFYASVARRAKAANTPVARQRIVIELYDKFFRRAFPKTAERLGIVYTPVELADFILHSVDDVLRSEFGQSLSSAGVQILDPFTGTGTFITRIIQNGLIAPDRLPHKYRSEIYAGEIMLLAYYIAAVNIEAAYHAATDADEYQRFDGICLTDTFDMHEGEDMIAGILPENSAQRKRQKEAQIRVIVSNPPWSAGQKSENDAAKNQKYPALDDRIGSSYAVNSSATRSSALYDSYVRAIRWASDRIGDSGVIGFVTNAGWIEGNAMDGMRKCLADEFTGIDVLHLRGNQRTKGELSRKEGGKVFGAGSRAAVAVTILVKNPAKQRCRIRLHDIGDYLNREEKLEKVAKFKSVRGIEGAGGWRTIKPNEHYDWIGQRDARFGEFLKLGDKNKGAGGELKVFANYSLGVCTNRDAWCYNYSSLELRHNVHRMIDFYNAERERIHGAGPGDDPAGQMNNDPRRIKWTDKLRKNLSQDSPLGFQEGRIVKSIYRPYARQYLYYGRRLNQRVYQIPQLFPHADAENRVICVSGKGGTDVFSALMVNEIPNLDLIAKSQCFPRWLYSRVDAEKPGLFGSAGEADSHGYVRRSALTQEAVNMFAEPFGCTEDDLFHYVYGTLHVPGYRTQFANNLRKELARLPLPDDTEQFWSLVRAGEALADLHVNYDDAEEWPVEYDTYTNYVEGGGEPAHGQDPRSWFRVEKPMRHPSKDRTRIVYNDNFTVCGVPEEAYEYMVNGKPAVQWVMERQCVKTDKASGIVNDANRYALETKHDPAYPLRLLAKVIHISMETVRIVKGLPEPSWARAPDTEGQSD